MAPLPKVRYIFFSPYLEFIKSQYECKKYSLLYYNHSKTLIYLPNLDVLIQSMCVCVCVHVHVCVYMHVCVCEHYFNFNLA